jgi:hypothetical protein
MKLTNNSKKIMDFFIKKKCIKNSECLTKITKDILKKMYNEIDESHEFIENYIKEQGYRLSIHKIDTISEVPKPNLFSSSAFPEQVRNHIDNVSSNYISYSFSLFGREIKIILIVEELNPEINIEKYNDCINKVLCWFSFITKHATSKCSKTLTVFIYFTSLNKLLPPTNIHILDENNVNTAFTYTCLPSSEIVIFRKEEWLKVLMHETMHNFALDFSDMNFKYVDENVNELFPVMTKGNSFEAYTEIWAELLNAAFCSYYMVDIELKDIKKEKEFLNNFEFFMEFERIFGFFQMVKVLDFMGLDYSDLYSSSEKSQIMRKTLYKEKSNVLSYYVIRVILISNFQGFLKWCSENNLYLNNSTVVQFKKTDLNMEKFFEFIKKNYKKKQLLDSVDQMKKVISKMKISKNAKNMDKITKKEYDFFLNNMRMTVCELG